MTKILTILLVAVALTGCSTMVSREKATSSLASATVCCTSMAQLPYRDISYGASDAIKINASSEAFQFPSGKSYFVAFRLPAYTGAYKITVQSYALGETIDKAHIFYPQVDLLDDKFNVLTHSSPQDFVLSKSSLSEASQKTWGLPVKLEGSVKVDSADIKYLVVYTTSELLKLDNPYVVKRFTSILIPGAVGAVPIATGTEQIAIPHSPFGRLFIMLGSTTE